MRSSHFFRIALVLLLASIAHAERNPYINLGFADDLALDQPRISIELVDPATNAVIGPDLAATFLLDTGANSILATDDSVFELNQGGYRTVGEFFEQGVAGFTRFDVSDEYTLRFTGSDGAAHEIEQGRILSSETTSFCPVPGSCSFFGIVGMPAMIDRVTTLDFTSIGGGFSGEIFEDIFNLDFMSTTFSDVVPPTEKRRFAVPVSPSDFRPHTEPAPSWADLPFLRMESVHQGVSKEGNFILDTGAQLSIISSEMAFGLGLDKNGNGILLDEAVGTQQIGGVGGTIDAPLMVIEEFRMSTAEGVDLIFQESTVAVVDIDPTIDGIFGMNYLTSGWTGAAFGLSGEDNLTDLEELLREAGLEDLISEIGEGGLGGAGSPYPFFEKVHLDFRAHRDGNGFVYFDLADEVPSIVSPRPYGDLDNDDDIDFQDLEIWVHDVQGTHFGDTNLDGIFDSQDMVAVFEAGEYDDSIAENSTWEEGDWNGDNEFDSQDLVIAFQDGAYVGNGVASVPEPANAIWTMLLLTFCLTIRRRS